MTRDLGDKKIPVHRFSASSPFNSREWLSAILKDFDHRDRSILSDHKKRDTNRCQSGAIDVGPPAKPKTSMKRWAARFGAWR
jgi:hypothetical protein